MKRKLPIGISSFEEIRTGSYYYVDKTPFVCKLVESGKYFFLSRPRRFGKSLFLDTLKQAFLGKRELFEGLFLHEHWDWSKVYPIVHLDFAGGVAGDHTTLQNWILLQLKRNQENLGIACEESLDYRACFEELIIRAYKKWNQKVVVLIDEYDKPILDRIEDRETARANREVLKNLYSVLKPLDAYLKLVFITGVSKFSKVSLFSGLNQLNDITIDRDFAEICGYTQKELETVFAEELKGRDLQAIKCWYNGYSFGGEPLYNPFDILLFLQKGEFRPFWFETGTPEFLVKLLFEKRFYLPRLEEITATDRLLSSFDVDFIEPEALLFQTGYLTIREIKSSPRGTLYVLTYPNKEVRVSLNEQLFNYYTQTKVLYERGEEVYTALEKGDLSALEEILRSLFAGIPYEWFRRNELERFEGYYASVVYAFFEGLGLEVRAEDYTSRGRIDLTVGFGDRVYVFKFKVMREGESSESAFEALKRKGYEEKFRGKFREIYLIGIDFDPRFRDIRSYQWEMVI